jgi:uncharacterized repeat protein (TIGR04052 family)
MRQTLCALALLTLGGCPEGDSDTDHDHDTDVHTGHPVDLQFSAMIDGAEVSCAGTHALGTSAIPASLADARLFVSNVQVRGTDGVWADVTLEQDGTWQSGAVALLDFEDGTAGCADSGTSATNARVVGTTSVETWDAVRFELGVPDELNHVDSATAPAPLNAPGMFWVWQSGYKFLRVDFLVPGGTPARWNIHLGSTDCTSDAPTQAPDEPCGRPNRPSVEIPHSPSQPVVLDLGALVAGADLAADTPDTPPGCMSSPTEPNDCTPTFTSLGLDFATGQCTGACAAQTFVSAE